MESFRPMVLPAATLILAVSWYACTGERRQAEEEARKPAKPEARREDAVERARSAADGLGADLMSKLAAELNRGGPAEAVRVCSEVAQEIAAQHSTEGLEVRRVSLRTRNSANRPDSFERAQLERLEALSEQDRLPPEVIEVVSEGDREVLRYLRPIKVAELCLQCHGERQKLDPEVKELLAKRYPEDKAVGYAAGDFRGAVSVRVE